MDQTVLPGIKQNVVSDFYLTPDYFEIDLATLHGSGFSIQPILSQSAYFRYHNRDPEVSNLYFTGAGTHPGAGLPGVVSSAKVVEALLIEDAQSGINHVAGEASHEVRSA